MEMWENQEVPWLEMQGDLSMQGKRRKVADRAAELAAPKEKWHQRFGNISWDELNELAKINIDSARGKLLDILCDYQGSRGIEVIAVFDAYRVQGHRTEVTDYHNIHVVFTKEAETADQYIEKTVHRIGHNGNVTVASSDGLEQIIIMGAGAHRLSARDLRTEIEHTNGQIRENYLEKEQKTKSYLLENASGELGDFLKELEEERKKESKKSKGKA